MASEGNARIKIAVAWVGAGRILSQMRHRCISLSLIIRFAAVLLLTGTAAGCSAPLSALDPAGPEANEIAWLWWVMLAGAVVTVTGVTGAALYSFRRGKNAPPPPVGPFLWGGGLVFPSVVLAALLIYALPAGQNMMTASAPPVLRVEAHGHQFWWEFIYPDAEGGPLYTASHLHVPAGVPFEVSVVGSDVIHSFWVPRLGGKIDAIPGRTNRLFLRADRPGIYRGLCSEFCGRGHAGMQFTIEAHDPGALERELAALVAFGTEPPAEAAEAFAEHCAACHSADARVRSTGGPNLAGLSGRVSARLTAVPADLSRRAAFDRQHQFLARTAVGASLPMIDDETLAAIMDHLEGAP